MNEGSRYHPPPCQNTELPTEMEFGTGETIADPVKNLLGIVRVCVQRLHRDSAGDLGESEGIVGAFEDVDSGCLTRHGWSCASTRIDSGTKSSILTVGGSPDSRNVGYVRGCDSGLGLRSSGTWQG